MKNVAVRFLALCAVGFPVGLPMFMGCAASVSPIDVMADCPEMPLRGPEAYASAPDDAMIADFETNGDLRLNAVAGRMGTWVGVSSTPAATWFGEASNRCVARGTRSGHLTSTAPCRITPSTGTRCWSSRSAQAHGWDASAYAGFSFCDRGGRRTQSRR